MKVDLDRFREDGYLILLNSPPVTAINVLRGDLSGLIDSGYPDWHRDASSAEQAPLSGMQQDLMENAPGYVQWNIPLYEDGVFWILSGSHKQPSTEAQRKQLLLDPRSPLEGGIPPHSLSAVMPAWVAGPVSALVANG